MCGGELASVAVTVKFGVPVDEGMPETTPVEELSDSPFGSVPSVRLQVTGDVPPLAWRVAL
jgi:hypothetical protein